MKIVIKLNDFYIIFDYYFILMFSENPVHLITHDLQKVKIKMIQIIIK
jgi:hypothetical protein